MPVTVRILKCSHQTMTSFSEQHSTRNNWALSIKDKKKFHRDLVFGSMNQMVLVYIPCQLLNNVFQIMPSTLREFYKIHFHIDAE